VAAFKLEVSGLSGKFIWTRMLGFTGMIWSNKCYIVSIVMSTDGGKYNGYWVFPGGKAAGAWC
jgi:hypothetical protein